MSSQDVCTVKCDLQRLSIEGRAEGDGGGLYRDVALIGLVVVGGAVWVAGAGGGEVGGTCDVV